ncbi:MAG: ComF family protein [Planctomycetes bacterium]|nr:ComF family protein [Planctomycetota bacterium]
MVLTPFRSLVLGCLEILLPRHCVVSGLPLSADEPGPVRAALLREVKLAAADYCSRCGAPQGQGVGTVGECASCRDVREGFSADEMVAAGHYQPPLSDILRALKFGGARNAAKPPAAWLTALVFDRGLAPRVDVVVPVPLHPLRLWHRGYNQAAEIARPLARALGKPLLDALRRRAETAGQARLSAAQRRSNVEGAFAVRKPAAVTGKTILLVDDVMTTGATFREAALTLKRAGAKAVLGAVAARATLDDDA